MSDGGVETPGPAAPRRPLPRTAGVLLPLFSLRGPEDCGTGEILDLIPFVDWLQRWRQGILQILPINEAAPGEASPYSALSAFAVDPAYISATRVPDVAGSVAARAWLANPRIRALRASLRARPGRDRELSYKLKLRLLEFGFAEFSARRLASGGEDERSRRFDEFCARHAEWLDDYALFRALKECHSFRSWESWPEELRRRDPAALSAAADRLQPRLTFARWLQWVAHEQWREVRAHARRRGVWIKGDLPFVCSRDSADVWTRPDLFDLGSSAGAPPDAFSATGQAWGLPLYDWEAMRRDDYAWWRRRARQAGELYDLFRIDHVVGLYRTYAIPLRDGGTAGFTPRNEHEQWDQGHRLMALIQAEAGGAVVVAEDLGTVPDWVRGSLTELGIAGYKVFRWERRGHEYLDPRGFSPLSIATTGTHDTDTLLEWWEGLDEEERAAVRRVLGPDEDAPGVGVPLRRILRRLYDAGSALTIVPFQDLVGWRDRVNTPATIDARNWAFRLPVQVEALDADADVRGCLESVSAMTRAGGRLDPWR